MAGIEPVSHAILADTFEKFILVICFILSTSLTSLRCIPSFIIISLILLAVLINIL